MPHVVNGNALTPSEVDQWCQKLLAPVTAMVRKNLGEEAADLAGGCLFNALRLYDKSRGDLTAYAKSKTYNMVIDACRSFNGRKGSARQVANARHSALEEYDAPEAPQVPGAALEEAEAVCHAIKTISRVKGIQSCILIGRVLCGFTNVELQRVLNVSQTKIYDETASLRQHVSLD